MSLISVCDSVYFHDFACLFVPFAESFKLVYVSWIGLYLNYARYT